MLSLLISALYKWTKFKYKEYPLSILYYHHVFEETNPYHPDDLNARQFEQQINYLSKRFTILSLDEAINLLKKKKLPQKALVISFDDGYKDNYTVAAPILKKYHCPATFFIASEGIEQGYLWNDEIEQSIKQTTQKFISNKIIGEQLSIHSEQEKITAFHKIINVLKFESSTNRKQKINLLKNELSVHSFTQTMMSKEQIKALYTNNFTIAAHTHSHTILTTETPNTVNQELTTNKAMLENIIQTKIEFLAYPNGLYGRDFSDEHCKIAQHLGFKAAFSTNDGGAISMTNNFKIPRFMPYRKQLPLFALSIAKIAGEHV